MGYAENDPESQSRVSIFRRALESAGFAEGKNIQIELRWANGDTKIMAQHARELVALRPDVIVANTTPVTAAVHRETKSIQVIFVIVSDPEGEGFVTSLASPSGNLTGFSVQSKYSPRAGRYFGESFETTARFYNLDSIAMPVSSLSEIENAIAAFASEPAGGLVVCSDSFTTVQRKPIIALAARHRLPAIYSLALFAADGGLLAFGSDARDQFARPALYVARVLNGERPKTLPVQASIKYELAINLKTAKALGLSVPPTLLARADGAIE